MHILSELEYGYIINLFRQIDYLDVTMKYVDKFVLINMFTLTTSIHLPPGSPDLAPIWDFF